MNRPGRSLLREVCAAIVVVVLPSVVSAQDRGTPNPAGPGPMTVERVQSGFLVAPEVKVTEFDHRTSELVGGYAGWLADQTFLIGGGGYWMANRSRDRELAYGGVVVGVMGRRDRAVGFGIKGLLGAGRATRVESVTIFDAPDYRTLPAGPAGRAIAPVPIVTNVRVRDEFFVAEPEGTISFRLSRHVHLTAGAGYRFAAAERRTRSGLNGASGNIALQIGG